MIKKKRSSGQALVEHLVLWPTLVLITMACIQAAFIFRGYSTLETATFMAAREGSVNNAFKTPMKKMLSQAMTPLDLKASPNFLSYGVSATTTYAENILLPKAAGGADIDIISPSKAMFNTFAKSQYVLQSCTKNCPSGGKYKEAAQTVKQIPNDNLSVRSSAASNVTATGGSVAIDLQDANLLKIRSHWCLPMEVPIINIAVFQTMNLLNAPTTESASCAAKTVAHNAVSAWRVYYIPLSASSIVRMQSPVRCEDNACSNLGSGGVIATGGGIGGGTGGGTNTGGNTGNGGGNNDNGGGGTDGGSSDGGSGGGDGGGIDPNDPPPPCDA